jgi:tyrosyl-tRNA synthetase
VAGDLNLLLDRAGGAGKTALVMPVLEGLDGTQKMSKSLGNQIGNLRSSRTWTL